LRCSTLAVVLIGAGLTTSVRRPDLQHRYDDGRQHDHKAAQLQEQPVGDATDLNIRPVGSGVDLGKLRL